MYSFVLFRYIFSPWVASLIFIHGTSPPRYFSIGLGEAPLTIVHNLPSGSTFHSLSFILMSPNISANRAFTNSSNLASCCWRREITWFTTEKSDTILCCSSSGGNGIILSIKTFVPSRGILAPAVLPTAHDTKLSDRKYSAKYPFVNLLSHGRSGNISEVAYPFSSGKTTLFKFGRSLEYSTFSVSNCTIDPFNFSLGTTSCSRILPVLLSTLSKFKSQAHSSSIFALLAEIVHTSLNLTKFFIKLSPILV